MAKTVKQRILDEIGDMHSSFVEAQIDSIGRKAQQLDSIVSEAIRLGDSGMMLKAVDELPETGEPGIMYITIPTNADPVPGEWLYDSNNGWIKMGTLGDVVNESSSNQVLALEYPSKFKPIHMILGTEEEYFDAGGADPMDISENVCFFTQYLENDPAQLVTVEGEQYRVYSVALFSAYDVPHSSGLLLIPERIDQ